jgi:hypothetical protein
VPTGTVLFSSSTPGSWSYTFPAGVLSASVQISGAGGGAGERYTCVTRPQPTCTGVQEEFGGAGGYAATTVSSPSGTYSGTIGSGGTANFQMNNCGNPGGATTVTNLNMTANGGYGACGAAGSPGTATGGQTDTTGGGSTGNGQVTIVVNND